MSAKIRILILEDEQFDVELIKRQLSKGGLEFESVNVDNRADFIRQLDEYNPNIVLADYKLPQFTGMDALEIVKKERPRMPFIIVTGSIGEDAAVECLKAGAWDYIIKERILRLAPAVKNALKTKEEQDKLAETQKNLKEREELHQSIFDTAADLIAIIDLNAVILDVNSAVKTLLGINPEEMIGRSAIEFIPPEARAKASLIMQNIAETGVSNNKEFRLYRKDGQPIDIIINAVGIKKTNGRFQQIVAIVHDITSRKQLEQQIQKDEKLKSISVLASGIAHDFNNFLTIILGSADLLQFLSEGRPELLPHIANIQAAGMRARDLTQQLLSFSKGGVPDLRTGSIIDLIKESAAFVLAGTNIQCKTTTPNDLWQVEMDTGQISQVLNNLIINAIQAMPEGGVIQITAANVDIIEEDSLLLRSGEYVKISVIDQGIGIPPENLNKIFDPFFTTKKTGSGLGLANAYTIVKNHRGLITAQSQVGVGTQFDIYLPATNRKDI